MNADRPMYRWRQMTPQQRRAVLEDRRQCRLPWHSPPHYENDNGHYLITAACYEHRPIIGTSPQRMAAFEVELVQVVQGVARRLVAWILLPNHYHLLVYAQQVRELLAALGKLHGSSSFRWNGEDWSRGRHVWCGAAETGMKSEGHYWATLNYVLHNAVRHGYVERWQDWPYSNAADYLEAVGREQAERCWHAYPILDYGKDWDPPEL